MSRASFIILGTPELAQAWCGTASPTRRGGITRLVNAPDQQGYGLARLGRHRASRRAGAVRRGWHCRRRVAGSAGLGGFHGYRNCIYGHLGGENRAPRSAINAVAVALSSVRSAASLHSSVVDAGTTQWAPRRRDPCAEMPINVVALAVDLSAPFSAFSVLSVAVGTSHRAHQSSLLQLLYPPNPADPATLRRQCPPRRPGPRQPRTSGHCTSQRPLHENRTPFMSADLTLPPPHRPARDRSPASSARCSPS